MRILFVDPPGLQNTLPNSPGVGVNLAIATLAPILIEHGHQVSTFDMENFFENRLPNAIPKALDSFKPDVVCFSILNAQYLSALNAINNFRKLTSVPIIVGGAEITAIKEKIFHDTSFKVNISVLGEGEEIFVKVLDCLEKKDMKALETVDSIIINNDGKLIKTGSAQIVKNLDKFPFPDLEILGIKKIKTYKIMGSRGCPFNCSFCFSYLGKTWRGRNPKLIIKELSEAKGKYDFETFRFLDALFNFKPEWVHEICDSIIHSDLCGTPWEAVGLRGDKMTPDLCKHMVEAGCKKASFGVETLQPDVFKQIKKGETIEKLTRGIKIAAECFDKVSFSLIIGLPGDNMEKSLFSYREAKKLKPTYITYALAVPYSATRLENWVKTNATSYGDSYDSFTRASQGYYSGVAFETKDFTKEQRLKTFRILNTKEFRYVTKSKIHRFLNPIYWLQDALFYDTLNFHKHLLFITKNIFIWTIRKFSSLTVLDKNISSKEIDHKKIPDGTWHLG